MDSLQNVKSLKIFKDFVVQGQGLVNRSTRTRTFLEDYNTGYVMVAVMSADYLTKRNTTF